MNDSRVQKTKIPKVLASFSLILELIALALLIYVIYSFSSIWKETLADIKGIIKNNKDSFEAFWKEFSKYWIDFYKNNKVLISAILALPILLYVCFIFSMLVIAKASWSLHKVPIILIIVTLCLPILLLCEIVRIVSLFLIVIKKQKNFNNQVYYGPQVANIQN
ncbi:hypothetical protein [Metamycoplasma hominis]|uniref:hypothetical protein n=1 Tax=Metamycoplasma hominis TaxID=2098 RepID=UPI003CF2D679